MMMAFFIHSRLVWYQCVRRSTTTSYLQPWRRSYGSMNTRSTSKRSVSPLPSGDAEVEPSQGRLEAERPADVCSERESDVANDFSHVSSPSTLRRHS